MGALQSRLTPRAAPSPAENDAEACAKLTNSCNELLADKARLLAEIDAAKALRAQKQKEYQAWYGLLDDTVCRVDAVAAHVQAETERNLLEMRKELESVRAECERAEQRVAALRAQLAGAN